MNLAELVAKHDAVKPLEYLPVYERIFSPFRDRAFQMLEIGVDRGGSIKTWCEHFPLATVIGMDIALQEFEVPRNALTFQANQCDPIFLDTLAKNFAPFQFVIDDASHRPDDWLFSFEKLWPSIAPGGWYFIEDVGAPRRIEWDPEDVPKLARNLTRLLGPVLRQDKSDFETVEIHGPLVAIRKKG